MMYLMFGILQGTITHAMHLRDKEQREATLATGCHRSHPHELMNAECQRITEVVRAAHNTRSATPSPAAPTAPGQGTD